MKHHFLSTIGVDYDLDLAPYWIAHYKACDFDTYTVFLHREDGTIPQSAVDLYRNAGFTVHCIGGAFTGGMCGAFNMENFIRNLPKNDFVTVADADEFQTTRDGSLIPYKVLCSMYDVLHGLFEERYSDNLSVCVKNPFEQYNRIEPHTGDFFKHFCPPYLDHIKWPPVYRCKIIAARASETYRFYGMHTLVDLNSKSKILFGLKVVHFAWREGAAKKTAKKSWYKKICDINPLTNELIPITKKDLIEQFS